MYPYEFDNSLAAVCAHHVISASFRRDKRRSSVWFFGARDSGIMRCPIVVFFFSVLFFLSFTGSLSAHSASTDDPFPAGHQGNLALLPAVYCKLQSHNLYFLKKKNITSNIY